MPTITVSKHIAAPAEAVWEVLADFGDVGWIPVAGEVHVDGQGPGMRRTLHGGGDTPVIETLIWVRPEQRALAYEIANNPLPVHRFRAVVIVTESAASATAPGNVGSTVTWEVDYEPTGDDASARGAIELVYGAMAGWLLDAVCEEESTQ